MDYSAIITTNPAVRSGKPCIRDTRVTVSDVLEYLAGGMTEDDILRTFRISPARTSGLAFPSRDQHTRLISADVSMCYCAT